MVNARGRNNQQRSQRQQNNGNSNRNSNNGGISKRDAHGPKTCNNCGRPGHIAKDCRNNTGNSSSSNQICEPCRSVDYKFEGHRRENCHFNPENPSWKGKKHHGYSYDGHNNASTQLRDEIKSHQTLRECFIQRLLHDFDPDKVLLESMSMTREERDQVLYNIQKMQDCAIKQMHLELEQGAQRLHEKMSLIKARLEESQAEQVFKHPPTTIPFDWNPPDWEHQCPYRDNIYPAYVCYGHRLVCNTCRTPTQLLSGDNNVFMTDTTVHPSSIPDETLQLHLRTFKLVAKCNCRPWICYTGGADWLHWEVIFPKGNRTTCAEWALRWSPQNQKFDIAKPQSLYASLWR